MYRLLMIDDEPDMLLAGADFLRQQGCRVDMAQAPGDAVLFARQNHYDAILLDVSMPNRSGFDLCGDLRAVTDAPVLFLSSLTDQESQLSGFACGGADYITKDCPLDLFFAKVKARIQFFSRGDGSTVLHYPPLRLDLKKRIAAIQAEPLSLTTIEFNLLALLASEPGKIWSVGAIYGSLWGDNDVGGLQMVQAHMSRMRRKLEKAFPQHEFLETVWGKGYQFIPMDENERT